MSRRLRLNQRREKKAELREADPRKGPTDIKEESRGLQSQNGLDNLKGRQKKDNEIGIGTHEKHRIAYRKKEKGTSLDD